MHGLRRREKPAVGGLLVGLLGARVFQHSGSNGNGRSPGSVFLGIGILILGFAGGGSRLGFRSG